MFNPYQNDIVSNRTDLDGRQPFHKSISCPSFLPDLLRLFAALNVALLVICAYSIAPDFLYRHAVAVFVALTGSLAGLGVWQFPALQPILVRGAKNRVNSYHTR